MANIKSFKPKVRLPRDGKPCKHANHFRNLARAIVSKADFLAGLDHERFVYAGVAWFQRNCKDYDSGEQWSRSQMYAAHAFVFPKIAWIADRERNGKMHHGYIVAEHAAISKILGSYCLFCALDEANLGPKTGQEIAKTGLKTGLKTGQISDLNRTLATDLSRTEEGSQVSTNQNVSSDQASDLPTQKPLDLPAGVLSSSGEYREKNSEECFSQNGKGKGNGPGKGPEKGPEKSDDAPYSYSLEATRLDSRPTASAFAVSDLLGANLEWILDAVTDGLLETVQLTTYPHTVRLKAACKKAIEEWQGNISDRRDCKKFMERVNTIMRAEGINPPKGWIPVIKKLKQGGPLEHVLPPKPVYRNTAENPVSEQEKREAFAKVAEEVRQRERAQQEAYERVLALEKERHKRRS